MFLARDVADGWLGLPFATGSPMHARTDLPLTVRTLAAIVLTLLLVLFVQAWASLRLRELVSHPSLAEDLPRLVGLPVLFLLAWLLIRWDRQQPARLFLRLPPARLVALRWRSASWHAWPNGHN